MVDREEKKTKRQEILDRLNSCDTGPHHEEYQDEERSKRDKTEREKALTKGRRGLGWIGGMGGM